MDSLTPPSQSPEAGPPPPGPGQQPEPGVNGCLGGCLLASLMIALVFLFLVQTCTVIYPPMPDVRESRTEIPSPSGRRIAIWDGYRDGEYFLSASFYSILTISDGGRSELVGKLPFEPAPQWLSDERLLITMKHMAIPKLRSKVLGVDIIVHLGDRLHVAARRKELEDHEASYSQNGNAGPTNRRLCESVHSEWQESREFWTWARTAADNGDPDPGPWVNKYYPADCSTLPRH